MPVQPGKESPAPRQPSQSLAGKTIAVTGASGTLGRRLVPELASAGATVALFGRDRTTLAKLFPDSRTFHNGDLAAYSASRPVDAILDLAVLNNRAKASLADFHEANVARFADILELAAKSGVPLVVGVSSLHALDADNRGAYAMSKREMHEIADSSRGTACQIVVLPKIIMADPASLMGKVWKNLAVAKPAAYFSEVAKILIEVVGQGTGTGDHRFVPTAASPRLYAILARLIDYAFAFGVLFVLGWAMILIGLVVRLDSPGPAIFAQRRVGQSELLFTLYKFRTMAVGTREAGTHEITGASVTRAGGFLRRFKLDELPQVLNILKGEIGLVGPRPCLPVQTALVEERRRHGIFVQRPGLTGLAQVHNIDMSDPVRLVEWEVRYLRLRGLALDLRIISQTFLGRGSADRVAV